jgi:hypothetical protein
MEDQKANRCNRGSAGGRPPAFDSEPAPAAVMVTPARRVAPGANTMPIA